MIFDTDVFIWIQRGNTKAAHLIESEEERLLSVQSYMELLQCAENRKQHEQTKSFLRDFGFGTLPLSENIGHRASTWHVIGRNSVPTPELLSDKLFPQYSMQNDVHPVLSDLARTQLRRP